MVLVFNINTISIFNNGSRLLILLCVVQVNCQIIVFVAITKFTFLHCDLLADGCDIFLRVSSEEHLSFPVNPVLLGCACHLLPAHLYYHY